MLTTIIVSTKNKIAEDTTPKRGKISTDKNNSINNSIASNAMI